MITGSAIARVMACPGSEALPHVYRTSEASEAGVARHTFLQFVRDGLVKALAMVPEEHHDMCKAIDLEGLPTDLASEVAFAWDWETGKARELGRGLERDYSDCGPTEIAGTIDALGVSERLYIGDYKGPGYVSAKDNAQLLFAAMCASKVYGIDDALLEIINIRDGQNWRGRATVDLFELAEFEAKLKQTCKVVAAYTAPIIMMKPLDKEQALKDIAASKPFQILENENRVTRTVPVHEGEHCRYCPAYDSCPAKTLAIRNILNTDEQITVSEESAADAYRAWKQMKTIVNRLGDSLHSYAAERPFRVDEKSMFGPHTSNGKDKLDGDISYQIIRDQLGQEAADMAVSHTATKRGIAAAVRQGKESGKVTGTLKAANDDILGRIRSNGGITNKPTTKVGVYKAELTA